MEYDQRDLGNLDAVLAGMDNPLAFLQGLFVSSPVPLQIYSREGRSLVVNHAFMDLFRTAPPPDYNIFKDENAVRSGVTESIKRAFAGELVTLPITWYDPRDLEHVKPTAGRRVAIQTTFFPWSERPAGPVSYVGVFHKDVTQELVRELELRRLMDSNIIGILTFDATGGIFDANDHFLQMVGYSRDDLQAGTLRWDLLTPKKYRSSDERALGQLATRGVCEPYEKEYMRKDGQVISVLFGAAMTQKDGIRGIAYVEDISERKHAQRALLSSERRFRALAENSFEVIKLVSADGLILYCSPSAERVLGEPAETMVNRSIFEGMHPDDVAAARASFEQTLATPGVPIFSRLRRKHKNGGFRTLDLVRVNWLHDPAVAAVVANFRDVTDRLALEEQFLQAQKMEAIGRLAGGIAHDFNNLLSIILSYATFAVEQLTLDEELRSDIVEIRHAAERAALLTSQLLAFSRRQVMSPRIVDLNQVVGGAENLLRRVIGEDVELSTQLADALGTCSLDPNQLEQALLNLVINARDALPDGGKITIETANVVLDEDYARTRTDVAPGKYIMLAVSDNGTGMSKAVQERIFEPFFTTKEPGKGTGLGLATIFGIVKQSAGHIWVYSEVDHGTTFKLYFPRSAGQPKVDSPEAPRGELSGREVVLLTEDDASVRQVARKILQRGRLHRARR
jgi:PAS domain S-box-containing protein